MTGLYRAVPKYYRIANDIVRAIVKGDILPGRRVPSENEIIKKYGVSNTTARKALQEVENVGWVTRVKGKGTFVQENRVERTADKILSFTKNMLLAGHKPSTKVLDSGIVRKDYSAVINGVYHTIRQPVFKIHRLRFADEFPMMLETRYISMALCPGIEKKDLQGSLYEIYENDYGLQLQAIDQMLSVETLGAGVRSFFDLDDSIPAFRVEGITFCGRKMILEMEFLY